MILEYQGDVMSANSLLLGKQQQRWMIKYREHRYKVITSFWKAIKKVQVQFRNHPVILGSDHYNGQESLSDNAQDLIELDSAVNPNAEPVASGA